jgi:hypothetical protein
MAHAVEKDGLNCDSKNDWKDYPQGEDEMRQGEFAAKIGPLSQDGCPSNNWSAHEENQDEFGKSKDDIRRKIGPRQVGRRNEPTGEQGIEWKGLVRKEGKGA